MAQSLADIYIHLTFSTFCRRLYLDADSRNTVCAYITGILKKLNAAVLQIGGAEEHVHVLFRLPKDITLMDLIRNVKGSSSKMLKSQGAKHRSFAWQAGYCAISVSPRSIDAVRRYIQNQDQHHRTETYREEILRMLREANMKFDEKYLWD